MKRIIQYTVCFVVSLVCVLWACQSNDTPITEPVPDPGEVEVEVDVATRAIGPSDGYVNDLIVMAFWRLETDPDVPTSYKFAYYSSVSAGAIIDNATGRRKVRFTIRKKPQRIQRFVFLANIYINGIVPHIFPEADIEAETIEMQEALNKYTYPNVKAGESMRGWSELAGSQDEPFPMCGQTKYTYSFADIEAGKVFLLNEDFGKSDETVYLYRMAAKIDFYFTDDVIKQTGGLYQMMLKHTSGKGYIAYNFKSDFLNSAIVEDSDWDKSLKAWIPDPVTGIDGTYDQTYIGITPLPTQIEYNDSTYTTRLNGPVYMNEAAPYHANDEHNASRFLFAANDGNNYGLELKYAILRNCHYHIYINKVVKGSLSGVLKVAPWTEVKAEDATPIPLR